MKVPFILRILSLTCLLLASQASTISAQSELEKRGGGGNDKPGSLSFHQQHFPIREDRGPVRIAVKRNGGVEGAVSVRYEARAGSGAGAATSADFTPISGVLQWADGDRSNKSFEVEILDDGEREGIETFVLTLSDPTGGASVDRPNAGARVQLLDDDRSGGGGDEEAGVLRFADPETAVVESAGTAHVVVERQGGSDGAITVRYETADGSATVGDDYAAASGSLSWADGDSSDKAFDVTVVDDSIDERKETVRLRLFSPTGGAKVHPVKGRAVVELVDDDGANGSATGVVGFERRHLKVGERVGAVRVVVERTRGSEGAIAVRYRVRGGSADAPGDYTLADGVLDWADGDAADKSFTLSVVDDSLAERKEQLVLILESPTAGVDLHPGHRVMTIEISDND